MKKVYTIIFVLISHLVYGSVTSGSADLDKHVERLVYIVRGEIEEARTTCRESKERFFNQKSLLIQRSASTCEEKILKLFQNKIRKEKALASIDTLEKYEQQLRLRSKDGLLEMPCLEDTIVRRVCTEIPDPLEILLSVSSLVDHVGMHPASCKRMFEGCFKKFQEHDLKDRYHGRPLMIVFCTIAVGLNSHFQELQQDETLRKKLSLQGVDTVGEYKDFLRRNPRYDEESGGDVDLFGWIGINDDDYSSVVQKNPLRLPLVIERQVEDCLQRYPQREAVMALKACKDFGHIHSSNVDRMIVNLYSNLSLLGQSCQDLSDRGGNL